MTGNGHVRFGGGSPQKYCPSPGQQLGGGLPNSSGLILSFPPVLTAYKVRFTRAGTYPYECLIHPGMAGTVVVH